MNPTRTSPATEIPLTISLVTANNKKLILDCLRSIYETTHDLAFEVFVVVNDSSDDSAEAIEQQFPDVKLIVNRERLGFTTNHNMVMKRGRGRYYMVLNDDTVILDGAFERTVEFMDSQPDTGIVGCRILNEDRTLQWSCGRGLTHSIEHFWAGCIRPLIHFLPDRHYHETTDVAWVTGACMMVRAEAARQVGLFDERIVIYYEDGDWCWRMVKAGWRVVFHPDGEIIHYGGKTREKHLVRDLQIIYQSRYYFFSKHYGLGLQIFVRVLTVTELVMRSLRCVVLYLFSPRRRKGMAQRLAGYSHLLLQSFGIATEQEG